MHCEIGPLQQEVTLQAAARLDQALGLPGRTLAQLCAAGRVRVQLPGEALGRAVLLGRPHLPAGARALVLGAQANPALLAEELPLRLLHDDPHLALLCKPAGMAMVPDEHHPAGTFANALRALPGGLSAVEGPLRPGIVHRLDLGTSGVLVIARSDAVHRALAAQFRAHSVERRYLALVRGAPAFTELRVESRLGRRRLGRKAQGSVPTGRPACTDLRVLAVFQEGADAADPLSLVEARPRTGRTHQIRVHLAELGHPLVGDTLYGGPAARVTARRLHLARPALHALELGVTHPVTGAPLTGVAPLPEDLQATGRFSTDSLRSCR